jgi:hypothetical protein
MATTEETVERPAPVAARAPDDSSLAISSTEAFVLLMAIVLLPLAITIVSLIGTHWHPSSDDALEVLKIRDVGGAHTPFTGVQSRFGWDHPGPLLFYLLAPFRWIGGDTAILVGAAMLNAVAIAAAMWLARRRGGIVLMAFVAVLIMVLYRAFTASQLLDPWNPWIALLPFLVYLLLAWSLAERDLIAIPFLVAVGSFLIQTHVAYAPLAVAIAIVATGLFFLRRGDEEPARPVKHIGLISTVVGVVIWTPPLIQQFTGHPGNLGEIISDFRDPTEHVLGWATAWGLMGHELSPPGPWITGSDNGSLGFVFTKSALPALALLIATLALAVVAWRRGSPSATRLCLLGVVSALLGVWAASHIAGIPATYLLRWYWIMAAIIWCGIGWAVWTSLSSALRARAAGIVTLACGSIALILAIVVTYQGVPAEVPEPQFSNAIGGLAAVTAPQLSRDRTYLMTWIDKDLGAVGVGTYIALAERGFNVKVIKQYKQPFGKWRVAKDGEFQEILTVVAVDDIEDYQSPPGSRRIADYDPLIPAERQHVRDVAAAIRSELAPGVPFTPGAVDTIWGRAGLIAAGAKRADVEELRQLRHRGHAYAVFLIPSR